MAESPPPIPPPPPGGPGCVVVIGPSIDGVGGRRGEIRGTFWRDFGEMASSNNLPTNDGGGRARFRALKYRPSLHRITDIAIAY